jgi:hypothetical protein
MACRQRRELFRAPGVEGTLADQECTNMLLCESCEAVSRSLSVLAFTTTICRPSTRAAACRSAMADWIFERIGVALGF